MGCDCCKYFDGEECTATRKQRVGFCGHNIEPRGPRFTPKKKKRKKGGRR